MVSRLLYVDADAETRAAVAEAFRAERLEVAPVVDGAAALDALDDAACVVTDHDPPDTDALALLAAVQERRPGLPFVVYTDAGSERLASEAFGAGVTDYAPHAVAPPAELAERVRELLAGGGAGGGTPRYRQPVETMGDTVYAVDETGRFTMVDEAAVEPSGYPREFLLHVIPREVGEYSTRGFAIYTDITARKERQRELERQNERLDEFASVLSHDLRNPLNVAQGHLELARETGDEHHFGTVADAHDRMEELVSGLLRLARQGEHVGDTEPVPLGEVVTTAWGLTGDDRADLEVVDDLPTVAADRDRLSQLLENLFLNSVEHGVSRVGEGEADAPVVTVRVGSLPDGFYVEDDGPGIPPDDLGRVFEYGYSRLVGANGESTGFGLAIVRDVAQAHGWTVRAAESESGGVRFEVRGVDSA